MNDNEELLRKSITTADLADGGTLNAEQQDRFVTFVKKFSVLLPQVRFMRMPQPLMDIDKLHAGEPVTEAAAENEEATLNAAPKYNKVTLSAQKLRSSWLISTEVLQSNIEQNAFEDTVMATFAERIATDLELLAIRGDSSLAPGTTPEEKLLQTFDGWRVQADSAHVLDAGGETISKELFVEAKRTLPKQYRNDPGLRWLASDTIVDDWLNDLSERATPVGDQALAGTGVNPSSIPLVRVPLIPDDESLSLTEATPAEVQGNLDGPFVFTAGVNDILDLDINNGGERNITFTAGTLDASQVASEINAVFVANGDTAVARVEDGRIQIRTTNTGAAAEIEVDDAAGGSTANTVLGLPDGVVSLGSDAGVADTLNEGSYMFLTNPKNLVWGILDGTRIFTEFNPRRDRIEVVVYNQCDAKIENLDSLVLVKNVRRKSLI